MSIALTFIGAFILGIAAERLFRRHRKLAHRAREIEANRQRLRELEEFATCHYQR